MNNLGFRESLNRANSHWRYWYARRADGNHFPLRATVRQWWLRFWFEFLKEPK